MGIFNKTPVSNTVNMLYGADGKLRTANLSDESRKVAKKNIKAFDRELATYDKDFINYASMDIDATQINDRSTQYILGKLNIANDYVNYVSDENIASGIGDDAVAIAGNKSAQKIGVGAKIASAMQPFFEKQAQKHPSLQKLSDKITKAANNGRMPLTAESAAIMKIAFDKKYYNDCRKPGADRDVLREQYETATENLKTMAAFDGVDETKLSNAISKKLFTQMKIDESLTDIYAGMSNGDIRLAPDEPRLDKKGKQMVDKKGNALMMTSTKFVDAEGKAVDAFNLQPREPQTSDEIVAEYQDQLVRLSSKCNSPADFKRMLASDAYRNIERNANAFAKADCPDDAAEFKHDFTRANIAGVKEWATEHSPNSPYAKLIVPDKYNNSYEHDDFTDNNSVDDYQDSNNAINDSAKTQVKTMSDEELNTSLKQDVDEAIEDISKEHVVDDINTAKEQSAKYEMMVVDNDTKVEIKRDEKHEPVSQISNDAVEISKPNVNTADKINNFIGKATMVASAAKMFYDNVKDRRQSIDDLHANNSLSVRDNFGSNSQTILPTCDALDALTDKSQSTPLLTVSDESIGFTKDESDVDFVDVDVKSDVVKDDTEKQDAETSDDKKQEKVSVNKINREQAANQLVASIDTNNEAGCLSY